MLTDVAVRNAKPGNKPLKLFDETATHRPIFAGRCLR